MQIVAQFLKISENPARDAQKNDWAIIEDIQLSRSVAETDTETDQVSRNGGLRIVLTSGIHAA